MATQILLQNALFSFVVESSVAREIDLGIY